MTNLELAVTIILTTGSVFWLLYLASILTWIAFNWQWVKHLSLSIEWPVFVFTPPSIGWMIYMGVIYL